MRDQSFSGLGLASIVLGLMACAFVPACQAAGGNKQASQGEQKKIEAMRASGAPMRVGIFDSRALATAYYRSETFSREMNKIRAEYDKAEAAGDKKRVAVLKVKGPAMQEMAHKQGFGTWSVNEILEKISKKLPAMAKQANVAVIVSKWDIAYQRSGVEFVDVTDLIVKPFNPDARTLEIIEDIQSKKPVPLEELTNHHDD